MEELETELTMYEQIAAQGGTEEEIKEIITMVTEMLFAQMGMDNKEQLEVVKAESLKLMKQYTQAEMGEKVVELMGKMKEKS